jgi:hypothetical protein
MKRTACMILTEIVLAGLLVTLGNAQSQSLGDYARAVRKEEKKAPAKQYDNDNLPTNDHISIVGNAPEPADATTAPASETTTDAKSTPATDSTGNAKTPTPSQGANKTDSAGGQKASDEWKQKFADQKNKIDLLSRELDVMQREYRLRAAAFYADAGNRLRNQGSWDKEDTQYKQQLAQKQKALDDAKKALADMQEQARKAGVPVKVRQ